jgi:type III secretory pathway lipoprotein EscJ
MGLVELARFGSSVQGDIARLLLEAEGIQAILFDSGLNYSLGAGMPVRLMVAEEDLAAAVRILAEEGLP